MKAVKCELCDSTSFIKDGDFYVCQSCGTKYTAEAARKLMVDVDDKADPRLDNLYQRARKSLEVNDLQHASEYFKQILDEKPNDWEAYFYFYLGEFPSFTNAQAGSVAARLGETAPTACDMAIADCDPVEAGKRIKTICERTSMRIFEIASCAYSLLGQYEGGGLGPAGQVHRNLYQQMRPTAVNNIVNCVEALSKLDNKVEALFISDTPIDKPVLADSLMTIRRIRFAIANHAYNPSLGITEKLIKNEYIQRYAQAINYLNDYLINVFYQLHANSQDIRFLDARHVQVGRFNNIPLTWTVILINGKSAKMVCDTCVIQGMISRELRNVVFEKSPLSIWLNNDFKCYAFSPAELAKIKSPDSSDAISIPTKTEVEESPISRLAYMHGTQTPAWWWTKTQAQNLLGGNAVDVDPSGKLNPKGHAMNDQRIGVRPTLWITFD